MRLYNTESSHYFFAGPVIHKMFEIGVSRMENTGFDFYWRFKTQGDHAGLSVHLDLWGFFFELSICDNRHWDWVKKQFVDHNSDE